MKTRSLLILAGTSAPLILSGAASAEFLGLKAVFKDTTGFEDVVFIIVNVYATFSGDPGDLITAVVGVPGMPLNINVRDGVFYQNPFGGDTAPNQALVDVFPSLAVDTFVTIGAKSFGTPQVPVDATILFPGWPGFGVDRLLVDDGGWYVTPNDLQGHPGEADNPANQVLLGQFSVAAGAGPFAGVFGTMLVQGQSGGELFQEYVAFTTVQPPAPGALPLLGLAGLLGCRRRRRE